MVSQLVQVVHIRHKDRRHEEANGNTQLEEKEHVYHKSLF